MHKKWEVIQAYFRNIPIDDMLQDIINAKIINNENILIMILKEENGEFTPEEKFKALCELYPKETKSGQIIISKVPDIIRTDRIDL